SASAWKVVFDSENARLYLDRTTLTDGWPDIIALPTRADDAGKIWRWSGARYSYHGPFGEEDEEVVEPKPEDAPVAPQPAAEPEAPVADPPMREPTAEPETTREPKPSVETSEPNEARGSLSPDADD